MQSFFKNLALYYRTAKHNKPLQLMYWFYHKLILSKLTTNAKKYRSENKLSTRQLKTKYTKHLINENRCFIDTYNCNFINILGDYSSKNSWNDNSKPLLWLYHLHYFDELNFESKQDDSFYFNIIKRWIDENPINKGGVGWVPFTVAVRITNWIKFFIAADTKISLALLESLSIQLQYLADNIEYQFLANHLISDCKGLIYGSIYLKTFKSNAILDTASKLLRQQLQVQINADGGHYERSPMYHLQVLYDLLDTYNMLKCNATTSKQLLDLLANKINKMLIFADEILHLDGKIAFFNDSCFDLVPKVNCIFNYALELGFNLNTKANKTNQAKLYQDTGYFIWQKNTSKLIVDCDTVAPTYQAAHAHAEITSFELSVFKQRFIVNSGTNIYANTDLRAYQRSSKAHNCLVVNNQSSAEVWHSFRVGARPRLLDRYFSSDSNISQLSISHNGYSSFDNKTEIIHSRKFIVQDEFIQIYDTIDNEFNEIKAYFNVHPEVEVIRVAANKKQVLLQHNNNIVTLEFNNPSSIKINDSFWYPEFSKSTANKQIEVTFNQSGKLTTAIFWSNILKRFDSSAIQT